MRELPQTSTQIQSSALDQNGIRNSKAFNSACKIKTHANAFNSANNICGPGCLDLSRSRRHSSF